MEPMLQPLESEAPSSDDSSCEDYARSYASVEDAVHIEDARPVSLSDMLENAGPAAILVYNDSSIPGAGDSIVDGAFGGEGPSEKTKVVLPEELLRSVVLTCKSKAKGGSCDVYLVGTPYVAQETCREVEALVKLLKPQVVFLGLSSSQASVLEPWALKIASKDENERYTGAEFRVAFEEAIKYGGQVVLGDRPTKITLRRTWSKMPLWHKAKLLYSILFQAFSFPSDEELYKVKDMDDMDILTLTIREASKKFPTFMDTLVHERDEYMAHMLREVAGRHNRVVAVVGRGHVQGIKKNWQQPITVSDVSRLMEIPAFTAEMTFTSLAVVAAGAALVLGLCFLRKR